SEKIRALIGDELKRRSLILKKLETMKKNLNPKKDRKYPLAIEQLDNARKSIWRLEDVKALIQ
ncbi:MAG: hypothetical protein HYY43_05620, partial [Deltaproteobacteria bacterium]|nr:hypothetical protein [Deltaproteobacteria bacterium]